MSQAVDPGDPVEPAEPVDPVDPVLGELAGPDRPLAIEELGAVLGGLRHVELAAFERLGRLASGGAASGRDPAELAWASGASLGHAWRAAQLEALLPVSVGLPSATECTRSPGPGADRLVEALDRDGAPEFYGLLVASYERRIAAAHPGADGPVVRTLRRLVADIRSSERVAG